MANIVWFFSGYGDMDSKVTGDFITANIDSIALKLETFFVVNKFVTIFSFLFGIGFAIQLNRIVQKKKKFSSFYVRRMVYLFLFGVIHFTFLHYIDILHLYAILGILLILFRSLNNRQLLFYGISFSLLVPVLVRCIVWASPILFGNDINLEQSFNEHWDDAASLHSAFIDGNYFEVIKANLADIYAWFTTDDAITTGISSFGLFLIGYRVGKSNLLTKINNGLSVKDKSNFNKTLIISLLVGITCQGILLLDLPLLADRSLVWVRATRELFWRCGVLSLALFYVCLIVVMYNKNRSSFFLQFFTPVGRMALTNYIGQSLFGVLIFYGIGFGFYGKVGPMISIVLTTLIFIIQAIFSLWWLKRFRFGPLEWLWRSLTYGKLEKLNHSEKHNK